MSRVPLRAAVLAAALALPLAAVPAAAAPAAPAPGYAPALTSGSFTQPDLFYRRPDGSVQRQSVAGGSTENLGGAVVSAPAALSAKISGSNRNFIYATAANGSVYWRSRGTGQGGAWTPWASLGGGTADAPAASCVPDGADSSVPVIWVRGSDGALWRRTPFVPWTKVGGSIASAPSAVKAVRFRECPVYDHVVAIGTDGAVWQWEFAQWKKVGGKSAYAPGIVRNPVTGRQHLVVVGSDGALWWSQRTGDGQPWSAFAKAGGAFTTAPSVALAGSDLSDPTVVVSALGSNGKLYRADYAGSWTFAAVP